ncbi:hypothetical protein ABW19_dt0205140 [Dactylella cylindrospora]|nr:hypothetical protein ABW19_dt0205140 [Dactylella cylindrospora]
MSGPLSRISSIAALASVAINRARKIKDIISTLEREPESLQKLRRRLEVFETGLSSIDEAKAELLVVNLGAEVAVVFEGILKEVRILCEDFAKALDVVAIHFGDGRLGKRSYIPIGHWEASTIEVFQERVDSCGGTLDAAIGMATLQHISGNDTDSVSLTTSLRSLGSDLQTRIGQLTRQLETYTNLHSDAETEIILFTSKLSEVTRPLTPLEQPSKKVLSHFISTLENSSRIAKLEISICESILDKTNQLLKDITASIPSRSPLHLIKTQRIGNTKFGIRASGFVGIHGVDQMITDQVIGDATFEGDSIGYVGVTNLGRETYQNYAARYIPKPRDLSTASTPGHTDIEARSTGYPDFQM